jgi:hypothetical protein
MRKSLLLAGLFMMAMGSSASARQQKHLKWFSAAFWVDHNMYYPTLQSGVDGTGHVHLLYYTGGIITTEKDAYKYAEQARKTCNKIGGDNCLEGIRGWAFILARFKIQNLDHVDPRFFRLMVITRPDFEPGILSDSGQQRLTH